MAEPTPKPRTTDIDLPDERVTYRDLITTEARKAKVPVALALAVAEAESNFNSLVIGPANYTGQRAIGTMQVLPSTGKDYNLNVYDPVENVQAGVRHLARLLERYDTDLDKVIAAYNAGEGAVDRAGGIPNFPETQAYVPKVKANFARYFAENPTIDQTPLEEPDTTTTTDQPTTTQPSLTAGVPWQKSTSRVVTPTIGAIGGAIRGGAYGSARGAVLGSRFGMPGAVAGGIFGMLSGATLGAVGAEGIQMAVEELSRVAGLQPGGTPPINLQGALRRTIEAGYTGLKGEAGGQIIGGGGRLLAKTPWAREFVMEPFKKEMQVWGPEALERFQSAGRSLVRVLPAQVTRSSKLQYLSNLAESSAFGGGRIVGAGERLQGEAERQVGDIVADLGPQASRSRTVREIQQQLPASPLKQTEELLTPTVTQKEVELASAQTQAAQTVAARKSAQTAAETRAQGVRADVASRQTARVVVSEARAWAAEQEAGDVATALGPAGTPRDVGAAALAKRQAEEKAWRKESEQVWGAWEQEAADTTVEAASFPQTVAFLEQATGRARGEVLPNAGTTAARRLTEIISSEAPPQGMLPSVQIPEVLTINGQRTRLADLPPAFREALVREYRQNPAKIVDDVVEGAIVAPDAQPLTAVQFQDTISDLTRLSGRLQRLAKSDPGTYRKQAGLVKKLLEVTRADFHEFLKTAKPEAHEALNTALNVTREGYKRLLNQPLLRLAKKNPEEIVSSLLAKNKSTPIRSMTAAIGEDGMKPIRAAAWPQLIKRNVKTNEIDWPATLKNLNAIGDDTLHSLFPNRETDGLKRLGQSIFEAERNAVAQAQADALELASAKAQVVTARGAVTAAEEAGKTSVSAAEARLAAQKQAVAQGMDVARAMPDPLAIVRDEKNTTRVLKLLFNSDNVETIQAVRKVVGDDGMRRLERIGMQHFLRPDAKTKQIVWEQVQARFAAVDQEALQALYPGGHLKDIQRITELMVKLRARPIGASGKVTGQMLQAGAVASILSGRFGTAAANVLALPGVLAYVMAHPTGARWFTTGLEVIPGSPAATRAAAQLMAFLQREQQREESPAPLYQPPGSRIAQPAAQPTR